MSYDINSQQVDIENLFKQNELDLCSIKELYRKLKEIEKKITQIKYIDTTLADKLKKDYEKLKRIILDENIQVQLSNKIDEIKTQLGTNQNNVKYVSRRFKPLVKFSPEFVKNNSDNNYLTVIIRQLKNLIIILW